jgi:hypothetical protein
MIKVLLSLALVATSMYAGGDIAPVEPAMEPVTSTGDALGMMTMFTLMFATAITGLFFLHKETQK